MWNSATRLTTTRFDEMNDDDRWHVVQTRDTRFDGFFVYAVRSTGIYCRPSCPSRRPRREQVMFFPSANAAEQAGFRACRRCQLSDTTIPQIAMVQRACRWIEENTDEAVTLAALSQELGASRYHVQRMFKRFTGITPRQYAELCRLTRLKAQLREGESVTNALYNAGYGSSSRLYERAKAHLGMTPNTYRHGGRGMRIAYSIVDCLLGRLLVGATEQGVCATGLSHSDAALEAFLIKEFPNAEIQRDEVSIKQWVEAILEYLDGRQTRLDLPIDIDSTDFQRQVWEVLRLIPYGSTRSYSEIACLLGRPAAMRAVAKACATNPAAVVVPCHRVICKGGSLGGYRWGIERKKALLKREQSRRMAGEHHTSGIHGD